MVRRELYSLLRLAGILSYIPVVMVSGPVLGFLTGNYLEEKFNSPGYVIFICVALGLVSSLMETIRIIRLSKRLDK